MSERVIFHFQCPLTDVCENNQCFWKQRDCYGLSAWYYDYIDESGIHKSSLKDNTKVAQKYGKSKFPKLEVSTGTNCINVWCASFELENEYIGVSTSNPERTDKLRQSIYACEPSIKTNAKK